MFVSLVVLGLWYECTSLDTDRNQIWFWCWLYLGMFLLFPPPCVAFFYLQTLTFLC